MYAPIILLAAAQMSAFLPNAYDRVTPEVAAARVFKCGAGAVTVKADAELDADILVIAGSAPVSDQQLACIDRAASFYDVELSSSAQSRFNSVRQARLTALMTSESRKWLKARGMLKRLPKYEPGASDDDAFGREVERLCDAKEALQSRYGPHVLSPDWALQRAKDPRRSDAQLECLINVSSATGFKMGFIGNERLSSD